MTALNVNLDTIDIILVSVGHILATNPTVGPVGAMIPVESATMLILQFMAIAFPAILPIAKHV